MILVSCNGASVFERGGYTRVSGESIYLGGETVFFIVRGGTAVYRLSFPYIDGMDVGIVVKGGFEGGGGFKSMAWIWDWRRGNRYRSFDDPGWSSLGRIRGEERQLFLVDRRFIKFKPSDQDKRVGTGEIFFKVWVEPSTGGECFRIDQVEVHSL
ncbi:hypothetical protein DRP77_08195 [Candidatus Poribacteria bacterium]|nr:MAG: hypothetical protein DRP77_08195 [Candidatus Poribacteria bacterium]